MKYLVGAIGGFLVATIFFTQTPLFVRTPSSAVKTEALPTTNATETKATPKLIDGTLAHADGSYSPAAESQKENLAKLKAFQKQWHQLSSTNLPAFKIKAILDGLKPVKPECSYISLSDKNEATKMAAAECFRKYLSEIWSHKDIKLRTALILEVLSSNFDDFPEIVTENFHRYMQSLQAQNVTVDSDTMFLASKILAANGDVDYFASFKNLRTQTDGTPFLQELLIGFRLISSYPEPSGLIDALTSTWSAIERAAIHVDSQTLETYYTEAASNFYWRIKGQPMEYQMALQEMLPYNFGNYVRAARIEDQKYRDWNKRDARTPAKEENVLYQEYAKAKDVKNHCLQKLLKDGL